MKEGWRNLSEVEELFEKRRSMKAESRIELLLNKISSIVGLFLRGQGLAVYQEDGDDVQDKKASPKLLF